MQSWQLVTSFLHGPVNHVSLEVKPAHSWIPHLTLGESFGKCPCTYTHASDCIYCSIMPIICIWHHCWSPNIGKATDTPSIMLAPCSINIMVPHGFSWKPKPMQYFSSEPCVHACQQLPQILSSQHILKEDCLERSCKHEHPLQWSLVYLTYYKHANWEANRDGKAAC